MLIRYLTHMVGHGFTNEVGDLTSIDDVQGQSLVDAGFAEFVPEVDPLNLDGLDGGNETPEQNQQGEQIETATAPKQTRTRKAK